MTANSLVLLKPQRQPLLTLEDQATNNEPAAKQEPIKVRLECPRCHWIFEVSKPDSKHPNTTYNQQETNNSTSNVIEEPRVCRNPKCKKQFTIYWHKKSATKKIG